MELKQLAGFCLVALALALRSSPLAASDGEESPPAAQPSGQAATSVGDHGVLERLNLELHGRVLVRASRRSEPERDSNDADLQNTRVELRWTPSRRLRGVFEWDFAEPRHLKDAWLRLRFGPWSLRAGQFKQPTSAVEQESRWDLPTSERGLLREVLVDAMGLAGRRPGIEAGLASKGHWDLDARLGLFLASHVRGDRIGDGAFDNFVNDYSLGAQKVAGRVALARKRFALGAFGEWRSAKPLPEGPYRRYWATGLDLGWSDKPTKGGRRVWADGYLGSSWQDANAFDDKAATFAAARVVAAWRRGGRAPGARYAEPYATFSIMDPDTSVRADVLWEAASGVNVGKWDRVRLTIEAQRRRFGRNVPDALGIFAYGHAPMPPAAVTVFVVQLGGRF